MLFFKPQVSFRLNFAIPFSTMTHNSSEISLLKQCMLWTKRTHQCTIFRLLGDLMKVHPICHAIFETTRSGCIQILYYCSVSWKINPLYFFSWNVIWFWHKQPTEVIFSEGWKWVVRWKFTKFFISYLKPQVSFSLDFASLFSVMGDTSSVLF